ncbi:hypothetical protein T12_9353 [Trichinella patagoniensis]|uniref:FLYWCH-type domain-containing protein n=1 Tax=Trichinella patagoniensis TaxID=990121 RepID=A0A0V0ZVZ6_9BILA|nr:hypothetical protein T12_9353 [Trichinella patagoniensis]
MADGLHLVLNERGNYNLVHQGRVYQVKHKNVEDKQWVCRRVKKGCKGSIHTNLDANAVLTSAPHAEDCIPDNSILYKMEKNNNLKRRAAEEMKPIPQIYNEEASRASADLKISGLFPSYKKVKTIMYRSRRAKRFPQPQATRQQLKQMHFNDKEHHGIKN